MIWKIGIPALCLLVCLPLFMYYKKNLHYGLAAMFKSCGTLCALVPALVAAIRLDPRCWVCVVALFLHAVADYLLEFNLLLGAGFFVAGHICYIAFFTSVFSVSMLQLICLVCLLVFSGVMLWRWRSQIGKKFPLAATYCAVLCIMSACALGCFSAASTQGIMIACGGALFFISDSFICRRLITGPTQRMNLIIMLTYYVAQLLFGFSCLFI